MTFPGWVTVGFTSYLESVVNDQVSRKGPKFALSSYFGSLHLFSKSITAYIARFYISLQQIKVKKKSHVQKNNVRLISHLCGTLYNFHIHYFHFHKTV